MKDATVYGESARTIMTTLMRSDRRITPSGMCEFELALEPEESGPVVRAMWRAEAELLIEDAADFDPYEISRTEEQRRADAFVRLVERAGAALRLE